MRAGISYKPDVHLSIRLSVRLSFAWIVTKRKKVRLIFYTILFLIAVMEYAALVLHTGLTAELADSTESTQKHALRIKYSVETHFVTHWQSLLYTTEEINYQQIFSTKFFTRQLPCHQ